MSLKSDAKAIQAALRCAERPAVLRTSEVVGFRALASEHWQGWLWPPLVGALASAESAALKPHCHFQVSELSSDGVAWQASN